MQKREYILLICLVIGLMVLMPFRFREPALTKKPVSAQNLPQEPEEQLQELQEFLQEPPGQTVEPQEPPEELPQELPYFHTLVDPKLEPEKNQIVSQEKSGRPVLYQWIGGQLIRLED